MPRRKSPRDKKLSGTYRTDREGVIDAPAIEPMMPKHLPERAQQIWRTKARGLVEAGLLSQLDGETFGLYCVLAAHLEECYEKGVLPSRDVMTHYRPMAKSFGLDPDARSKLGIKEPRPKKDNPFAAIRRRHPDFDDL